MKSMLIAALMSLSVSSHATYPHLSEQEEQNLAIQVHQEMLREIEELAQTVGVSHTEIVARATLFLMNRSEVYGIDTESVMEQTLRRNLILEPTPQIIVTAYEQLHEQFEQMDKVDLAQIAEMAEEVVREALPPRPNFSRREAARHAWEVLLGTVFLSERLMSARESH